MTIIATALSVILLCLLLTPIFFIYQNKKIDFLDPLFFVVASVALGVLIRGVYLTCISKNLLHDYIVGLSISDILSGYLFVFFALVFFSIGYSGEQKEFRFFNNFFSGGCWSARRVNIICVALILISLVSWIRFLSVIDLSSLAISTISRKRAILDEDGMKIATGYLRWGASLMTLAYFLYLIKTLKKTCIGVIDVLILLFMFAVSIAFPIFTSSRIEVISAFINTIIIIHFLRAKINRTFEAKYFGGLLVAFIVLALLTSILANFRRGNVEYQDIDDVASVESVIDSLVGNQNFYGIGKSTVAFVEGEERLYGKTLVSILTAPIPRRIWPEKPEVGMSYYFGSKYYGLDYTGNQGGGMPPGISIELFLNFGLIGLAAGMWLYGFFLRAYYKFISKFLYERSESAVLIHTSILMPATFYMTGNDIAQAVIAMATLLIPSVFCIFLVRRQ